MAICSAKSIVYHIPKCGGIWVKEAMRASGIVYGRCRDHPVSHPFALKREHATPRIVRDKYKHNRFSFCFVRRPVAWLKSFWCYRVKTGWLDTKFPPDRYWDDFFDIFVDNLMEAYPNGFVTQLYKYYVDDVDFVGRQETLADDLVRALTLAGEHFDEGALRSTKWRNVSAANSRFSPLCHLSKHTTNKVLDTESWVLERFYA